MGRGKLGLCFLKPRVHAVIKSGLNTENSHDEVLHRSEKSDAFQNRVHKIRHDAEMRVLGSPVMGSVMFLGLYETGFLDLCDQPAIFLGALVRSSVYFVCKHAKSDEGYGERCERTNYPESAEKHQANREDFLIAGEEFASQETAGCMMVELVLCDRVTKHRPLRISVSVLEPVKDTRQKICKQNACHDLSCNRKK